LQAQPNVLNELFKLILLILKKRADAQQLALKMNLFKILSNLIGELKESLFDKFTVELIKELRACLIEPKLLDQFLVDFLWTLDSYNIILDFT